MSSTETLTFGPQWLRELSGGSDKSNTNPPIPLPPSRFKLAKYRYGREEMLALFLDEEVIPEDLHRVPYVVVEVAQRPLALTPMNDNFQPNVSEGRGMTGNSFHEHSVIGRGRGRGNLRNGDMFVGLKEPLRRPDKKDWRSISEQPGGKGDGQDDIFGDLQDWRSNSNRNDMTRGLQDPWYDRNTDVRNKKQIRNRSLSAKDKSTPMFLPWPDKSPNEPLSPELNQESPQNTSKVKKDCEECEVDIIPPNEKIEILVEKEKSVEVEQLALTGFTEVLVKEEPTKTVSFPVPQAITTVINNEEVVQVSSHLVLDLPKEDAHDIFLQESRPIAVTSGANLVQPNPPQLIPQVNPITHLQILATTWFYKDPQGKIQGPFNSSQMMEWFKAGYFARELLVKRACDVDFIQLGNLIESCGYVPFKQYEIGPTHVRTEEYHSDIARQTFVDQQRLLQEQHLLRQQGHFRWPQQEHSIAHQNFAEITRNNDQWNKEQFLERIPQHTPLLHQNSLEYGNVMNYEQYNHTVDSSKELSLVEHLEDMVADVVHTQSEDLISPSVEPLKIQSNLRTPEATVPQHSPEHEVVESKGMQFIEMTSQEIRSEAEPEKRQLIDIVVEQKSKIDVEQEKSPQKELEQQSKIKEKSAKKGKDGKTTKQESKKKREEMKQQKNSKENKQKNQEKQAVEQKKKTIKENTDRKKEVESNEDTKNKVELRKGWNQQREISPIGVINEKTLVPAPSEYIEQPYNAIPENVNKEKPKPWQEPITVSLPPTVYWAHNQPTEEKQQCLSLFEIQQMEEKSEQIEREQMRKLQVAKQQEKAQQVGWAQKVTEKPSPKSFWEIQREEQMRNQASSQQPSSRNKVKNVEKNHATIVASKKSASFWDQVVEENKPAPKPTPSRAVQKVEKPKQTAIQGQTRTSKKTNEEKQTQRMPRDIVIEHCENYLRRINAEHIDIPTFVNFLYDVESPDEVREYVTSYLGENGGAKEFSKIFLEMRSKSCSLSKESSIIQISREKSRAPAPMDDEDDGFKLVKVNTKNSKNKRRQRKLQKADPSLLGFSVNAASDRVNMGEIENTNNH